jgi:hypothetical protein
MRRADPVWSSGTLDIWGRPTPILAVAASSTTPIRSVRSRNSAAASAARSEASVTTTLALTCPASKQTVMIE